MNFKRALSLGLSLCLVLKGCRQILPLQLTVPVTIPLG
ncbi:hypothetical protein M2108_006068 [Paenibacillus sp. PastM-3]|nr:hypothetical protein [Paenibacillus sp. PastM-3]